MTIQYIIYEYIYIYINIYIYIIYIYIYIYCDPHHKHIIKGELRIIENKKCRKLLTKNPNNKETRRMNFRKAYIEINQRLEACIEKMSTKNKLETPTRAPWRESVSTMVNEKN